MADRSFCGVGLSGSFALVCTPGHAFAGILTVRDHGVSVAEAATVVVYTHREPDAYRLISAWKANKTQRKLYEKSNR